MTGSAACARRPSCSRPERAEAERDRAQSTLDRDALRKLADAEGYDAREELACAVPALLDALDQAERERDETEAAVQRVRRMHEPVPVSECTTACSCGWWSHADCPNVQALDGGGES